MDHADDWTISLDIQSCETRVTKNYSSDSTGLCYTWFMLQQQTYDTHTKKCNYISGQRSLQQLKRFPKSKSGLNVLNIHEWVSEVIWQLKLWYAQEQ